MGDDMTTWVHGDFMVYTQYTVLYYASISGFLMVFLWHSSVEPPAEALRIAAPGGPDLVYDTVGGASVEQFVGRVPLISSCAHFTIADLQAKHG